MYSPILPDSLRSLWSCCCATPLCDGLNVIRCRKQPLRESSVSANPTRRPTINAIKSRPNSNHVDEEGNEATNAI
jgi:hypothetical protein